MSRSKLRLDYVEFHNRGIRVEKKYTKMDDLHDRAVEICSDIDDISGSFDVSQLSDEEELTEYVNNIGTLKRDYGRIHAKIKDRDPKNFKANYPYYDETLKTLTDAFQNASKKLRDLKRDRKLLVTNTQPNGSEVVMRLAEKRNQCRSEREYFVEQAEWELTDCNWDKFDNFIDIKSMISSFETLLADFFKICSELKGYYGDEYKGLKLEVLNKNLVTALRDKIASGRKRLETLKDEHSKVEKVEMQLVEDAKNVEVKNILSCSESLVFEIQNCYESFKSKCEVDFAGLNDFEILDVKKHEDSYHLEIRELFAKISSFEKYVAPCGLQADTLKKKVIVMRDNCKGLLEGFLKKLNGIISEKDISERKLKNSAGLKIELGKFKGYESNVDIYTFRSDFSKLVEPEVRKNLWADYLKKNHLAGAAQNLVAKIEDIESIWEKLIQVYGNTEMLLQNKIASLKKFSDLESQKDDEKIAFSLSSLLNMMTDLKGLAEKFDLEGDLYYGGGLLKVLDLLGKTRERRFIKSVAKDNLKNPQKWAKLVTFLTEELAEREAYVLNEKSKSSLKKGKNDRDKQKDDSTNAKCDGYLGRPEPAQPVCHICGKSDGHVFSKGTDGKAFIDYVACPTFSELTVKERHDSLFKKRLCNRCLKAGAKYNDRHDCDKKYVCNHDFVNKAGENKKCIKHVLVCPYHNNEKANRDLLEIYKKDLVSTNSHLRDVCKSISCFSKSFNSESQLASPEDASIFAFQRAKVGDGVEGNFFYDGGCGSICVSTSFKDRLVAVGRARCLVEGPIVLEGAGGQTSSHDQGIWELRLQQANGEDAIMTGICCETLTSNFPMYSLKSVENDFRNQLSKTDPRLLATLPSLPEQVGGKVDLMIGKQYLKHSPREVAQLESCLTLYKSRFEGSDGSLGVLSGPHPEFTEIERTAHFSQTFSYHVTVQKFIDLEDVRDQVPLIGYKETLLCEENILAEEGVEAFVTRRGPKCLKRFETIEATGTNISYRCGKCRNCSDCKTASRVEEISLKEEAEQDLINRSVHVDVEDKHEAVAELPFITDPKVALAPTNYYISRKVYNSVLRALAKDQKAKEDTLKAENKLHKLGYVEWLHNLSTEDQKMIQDAPVKYYLPWRVVWSKSLSTPARPVFDASQGGSNGVSLNDILPKGANNMNNLVQILIRWIIDIWAFHTDIRTMYNRIKLLRPFWCYQLYLWQDELDPSLEPLIKVIMTVIYGVRPSGNQAERAIRITADKNIERYPKAHVIIHKRTYVDDVLGGEKNKKIGLKVTEELRDCLATGGFGLKGFTFSGDDPDESLSEDKESVMVAGLRWYSKEDYLMINVDTDNFNRKVRGKKSLSNKGVPQDLTMRDVASKVAEVFEPLGKLTPIIISWKLDISLLHRSGLTWDDILPDNLRKTWVSHFEMMQEISQIKYKRAIVPVDAKNLDIVTLDTGDASSVAVCVAIYARFERKDGTFSCQLVFGRSRVLPEGTTIPRAELMASHMNAATGHTVKTAFGDLHKKAYKLSDSMVALHWICSKTIVLKAWCRARVIEIGRLTEDGDSETADNWFYVESANMVADIGTRGKAKIADVTDDSPWIQGLEWMSRPESEFPIFSLEDRKISAADLDEVNKEKIVSQILCSRVMLVTAYSSEQTKSRYQFSNYILDPNKFRFRKVVRVVSLVLLFIKNVLLGISQRTTSFKNITDMKIFNHEYPGKFPRILENDGDGKLLVTCRWSEFGSLEALKGRHVEISPDLLRSSLFYFSRKASIELEHFIDKKRYVNITKLIDGVFYYSGRILDDVSFGGYPELCQEAIDLCPTSFCVPVMDQHCPVAISIALEIHWYHDDVQHKGIESMLRQTEAVAHILGGRNLVKSLKDGCKKCRILNKASVDVVMGPLQSVNLCIAPAFYASQVDLFGPFKAYSPANKRATLKVWFAIFCCCTTGAVDIRVMEDYSTDTFISGFIRFSCRFGYPKYLLPDAGSQLVKGCEDMQYSFLDTKQKLSTEYGTEFTPCPVGAHYVHGKVERKIQEVRKSVNIHVHNERLSIMQWETLMQQISNSINNHPIGLKYFSYDLDNLDLVTPNRLILGRNNDRCPNSPLILVNDHKKMIKKNADIFRAWFKAWLESYLPTLMERSKWHKTNREMKVGDIVLFLKSDKEFDEQYQYGIISKTLPDPVDGHVRKVDVTYKNHSEGTRRVTSRDAKDLVIVYPIDELDIYEQLDQMVH